MPNEPTDIDDQQAQDRSWTPQPDGPAQERALQQHQSQNQDQSGGGVSGLGDSDQARQQGGQAGQGQQRQFDAGSGQPGGSGGDRFADQIREHQEVIDDAGGHVGTVDHVDGDRIKLARSDSSDGQHHYVSLSQIAGIEGDKIRLRERGDNDFGQEAGG